MDFTLSEEQSIFRDSVARFVAEEYAFDRRQALVGEEPGFSEAHWERFAELGWLAATLPEDYGGLGGTPVEAMLLAEQFGRGLIMSPYLATVVLGANAILHGGSEKQKHALLPEVAEGRLKLAFAFAEPQSRYELNDVATTARAEKGGYRIDGHKGVVFYAASADRIVVSARSAGETRDSDGISLFLVDAKAEGLTARHYPTQDGGRASELRFDGVRVGAEDRLGEPGTEGSALPVVERVIDHAIASVCAEAVGEMWTIYEQTLAYLKDARAVRTDSRQLPGPAASHGGRVHEVRTRAVDGVRIHPAPRRSGTPRPVAGRPLRRSTKSGAMHATWGRKGCSSTAGSG